MDARKEIQLWMAALAERSELSQDQIDELESHLLDSMDSLMASGLKEDEAYLIAVKRLGTASDVSSAQIRQKADRIWKDLFNNAHSSGEFGSSEGNRPLASLMKAIKGVDLVLMSIYVLTTVLALLPTWTGHGFDDSYVYFLNVSWMVIPSLAILYVWRDWNRGERSLPWLLTRLGILFAPLIVNLYPFQSDGQTINLAVLHLPLAAWLILSLFRDNDILHREEARMDYIRFTGEALVYSILVGLSILALIGLSAGLFGFLGVDIEPIFEKWIAPLIFPLTLLTGVVLVERKRSLVENFAPVLARIIAPLLLVVLALFTYMLYTSTQFGETDRDVLILMDLLLLAVVMVVIYGVSTRSEVTRYPVQDTISLLLVILALLSNGFALGTMVVRLVEYGVTANKFAAFGANLLLMGNLTLLMIYFVRQLKSGVSGERLLSVQGWYFVAYFTWFLFVALGFPLLFNFA